MSNILDNSQPSADDPEPYPGLAPPPAGAVETPTGLQIEITIDTTIDTAVQTEIDTDRCRQAARAAAAVRGFTNGELGIRITDDPTIRQLNRQHLGHDYETDVISFPYNCDAPMVSGELVASVDTARLRGSEIGWPLEHELLLYIVHGVLHITGMDDHASADRAAMRQAEQQVMLQLGIEAIVRYGADSDRCTESAAPETNA